MALITCPECGKQVSSVAPMCPSCGFPIASMYNDQVSTSPKSVASNNKYNYVACNPSEYKSTRGSFKYTGTANAIIIPDEVVSISNGSFKRNVRSILIGKNVSKITCTDVEWFEVSPENPLYSSLDGVLCNKEQNEIIIYPKLRGDKEYSIPTTIEKIRGGYGCGAFSKQQKLETITLHENLEVGYEAFKGASHLSTIKWADNLFADNYWPSSVKFESDSFSDTNIKHIELSNTLETITSAFAECQINYIDIPNSVTEITSHAFKGWKLKEVSIPNSVESIGDYAFEDCILLRHVSMSNAIKSIGVGAFYGCSSLDSIELPQSLISLGDGSNFWQHGVFQNCVSLKNVKLSSKLKILNNCMFKGCKSLEKIDLPNSIESIGKNAFEDCSLLSTVNLPINLKTIQYGAFFKCEELKTISLPIGLESIGNLAFGCTSIKQMKLPDTIQDYGDLFDKLIVFDMSEEAIKRLSPEQRAKKADYESLRALIDQEPQYVQDGKRLFKKRNDNRSKLESFLNDNNIREYNNLLLDINEINRVPIAEYHECDKNLRLYDPNGIDGTFAIEVDGKVHIINFFSVEIIDSSSKTKIDTSELDKAVMAGIAGGSFLGYIATACATIYNTINHYTVYKNKENGDIIRVSYGDNYRVPSSSFDNINNKIIAFIDALTGISDKITVDDRWCWLYIQKLNGKIS